MSSRESRSVLVVSLAVLSLLSAAGALFSQPPSQPRRGGQQNQNGFRPGMRSDRKHVLAWADVRNGSQHESIWHAIATIEKLGHDSGLYDTIIRTDSQVITKRTMMQVGPDATPGRSLMNLNAFDAIFFYGAAGIDLAPDQKADLLSFIKDDGKGFVAVHTSELAFPALGGIRRNARGALRRASVGNYHRTRDY